MTQEPITSERPVLSDERLRECPFCGGPAITLKDHRRIGVYICCQECFCNTPTGEQKEVTAIWNSRRAAEQQEPVDEADEAYEIGKRDGYEEAIQELDVATGGDGEFKGSTFPGETVDVPVMRQRIIDRLASPPPVPRGSGVRVKPLEWHGPDVNDEIIATSILGRYSILPENGNGYWLSGVGGYFDATDEAKAAAQADYELRILSAILGLEDAVRGGNS